MLHQEIPGGAWYEHLKCHDIDITYTFTVSPILVLRMDDPSQNLGHLRQCLLYKRADISVERPKCLVANMPRQRAAIVRVQGGTTQ